MTPTRPFTATLTPAGATLGSRDDHGLALTFPPGAVAAPVQVSFRPVPTPTTSGATIALVEFALDARDASGVPVHRFTRPYTITLDLRRLPLDTRDVNPVSGRLAVFDPTARTWQVLPGGYDAGQYAIVGTSDHFSTYQGQFDPVVQGMANILSAQTNLHTGSVTWQYPIELLPGPGGSGPRLAVTYHSLVADEMRHSQGMAGWLGMGWNLAGLGSIRRVKPDDGLIRYYLTVGGVSDELVGPSWDGSAWVWHTKRESFYRIRFVRPGVTEPAAAPNPDTEFGFFEVWDRSGTYYRFGGQVPEASEQYSWLSEEDRTKPHSLMWYAHWQGSWVTYYNRW
ncbi:MAG: hypothetical protein HY331_11680, partial [Chloroflexi bacterium]|nr:hypothetical protein [Chloroflexota bacterium]